MKKGYKVVYTRNGIPSVYNNRNIYSASSWKRNDILEVIGIPDKNSLYCFNYRTTTRWFIDKKDCKLYISELLKQL